MLPPGFYSQSINSENRLTHALGTVLVEEPKLLKGFLRWAGCPPPPSGAKLEVLEQRLPGENVSALEDDEERGLPDLWIHDGEEWSLLVESKISARLTSDQLRRHVATAQRRGFNDATVLSITTSESPTTKLGLAKSWGEVYAWASKLRGESGWAAKLVQYMQVAEVRMSADGYLTEGTITMFDGVPFDADNPYNYPEAKRVIRLMMGELRKRKDLRELGIDPNAEGRSAITGKAGTLVWDYLSLTEASGAVFTKFPHLTLSMSRDELSVMVTLPNGVARGLRKNLVSLGLEEFTELVVDVARGIEQAVEGLPNAKPHMYILQRNFPSQRSAGIDNARLAFDPRTATRQKTGAIKYQPQWIEATFEALANKKSNLQLGLGARMAYGDPELNRREVLDRVAGVWCACGPWLEAILAD